MSVTPIRLGRREAANYLSLSVRSVDYLIEKKTLPPVRQGGRVFVLVADLDRYAAKDHAEPIRSGKAVS